MRYTDEQRAQKICRNAERLNKYIEENNISKEKLMNDYTLQWLVTTPLYNIGENAYNLSDEYKEKFVDIPWGRLAGLRHRLVHDYDETNWEMIANILFKSLPDLIEQLKKMGVEAEN